MKKSLITILLLIISTTFVFMIFSISFMESNHSTMATPCPLTFLSGNNGCPVNETQNTNLLLEHINSIGRSILMTFDLNSINFSLIFTTLLLTVFYYLKKKFSLIHFFENKYKQYLHHNDKAYFPIKLLFLLTWLTKKIRGSIDAPDYRVSIRML